MFPKSSPNLDCHAERPKKPKNRDQKATKLLISSGCPSGFKFFNPLFRTQIAYQLLPAHIAEAIVYQRQMSIQEITNLSFQQPRTSLQHKLESMSKSILTHYQQLKSVNLQVSECQISKTIEQQAVLSENSSFWSRNERWGGQEQMQLMEMDYDDETSLKDWKRIYFKTENNIALVGDGKGKEPDGLLI